jgi:hypothetical protein
MDQRRTVYEIRKGFDIDVGFEIKSQLGFRNACAFWRTARRMGGDRENGTINGKRERKSKSDMALTGTLQWLAMHG